MRHNSCVASVLIARWRRCGQPHIYPRHIAGLAPLPRLPARFTRSAPDGLCFGQQDYAAHGQERLPTTFLPCAPTPASLLNGSRVGSIQPLRPHAYVRSFTHDQRKGRTLPVAAICPNGDCPRDRSADSPSWTAQTATGTRGLHRYLQYTPALDPKRRLFDAGKIGDRVAQRLKDPDRTKAESKKIQQTPCGTSAAKVPLRRRLPSALTHEFRAAAGCIGARGLRR